MGNRGCSDGSRYRILRGKSSVGKRTASDRQRDRTGTGAAGVPGDSDRRNCNAGTNRARKIQCRGERRGWGQQYRSHWDPEYGNQCGSYRTGAVSGIGSGLHHYLDGLLCHKPGNFPGGKNGERRGIPGDVSGQRRKKSDHDRNAGGVFLPKRRSGTRGQGACGATCG